MTKRRALPIVALGAIYVVAVVVYALIAHRHRFPNLFPDEMFYGKLAQSFAHGDGLRWRGSGWGLPPLWPALLSVSWKFGSVPDGYDLARVVTALVAATVVVPVWLMARELAGPRLALVPAALAVTGAWMTVTAYLVSENLAFPLGTASLACTVIALRDTRMRWVWGALAFALVAALTRTQMLALPVILLVALVLDVVRQPPGMRRARIDARPRALWAALALVVAGGLLAFVLKPGLTNYDVLAHHASPADVAATAGRHAASSIVMFAFIPVAAVGALMARAANWRDDRVGPLLVTIVAGVLVLYPLLGRFEAWATHGNPVDRYAMYLAPLFLTALVLAPGRIGRGAALASAVVVALILFAVPITNNYIEQPALYGTQKRLFELGFFDQHLRLAVVLAGLIVMAAGSWFLAAQDRTTTVVLIVAVMVAQAWTSDHAEIRLERGAAAAVLPHPRDWVDRAVSGPAGMLALGAAERLRGNPDLYTEFFNRRPKRLYSDRPGAGGECLVAVTARGVLQARSGECGAWPRDWVIFQRFVRVALDGQRQMAASPPHKLVRVPAGPPRLLAAVTPSCTPDGCSGRVRVSLYLDAAARVAVRLDSGRTLERRVTAGDGELTLRTGDSDVDTVVITTAGRAIRL